MSENLIQMIYDELCAHRKESADFHKAIETRVRSLEETRAEGRGAVKVATIFSSIVSFAISFLVSHSK
jgi:hypothetical protein